MRSEELKMSKHLLSSRRNRENFKSLRANINFAAKDSKVILVTSSIPGEGKSSISMNLAFELSQNGSKVLLLDCDLRKSKYADLFRVAREQRVGLTQVLQGEASLGECVWRTDVKNLHVVLAGNYPPNPAELLNSGRFAELVSFCKDAYDYIILDTAPITQVIDAALLCKLSDGVVFVIGSDMISCRIAQKAVRQLERAGGHVIGCVLNKIRYSNRALYGTYGTSKYYYGSYGNYYGDGEKS